jgi:two-component system, OmpR family, copper resistance phosphate regulon response regulator CusR
LNRDGVFGFRLDLVSLIGAARAGNNLFVRVQRGNPGMSVSILVVEDEDRIRETINTALLEEGYTTTAVESAEEALYVVSERVFQAAIIDVNLPKRSGLEFLARLRERDREIAVIVVSAKDSVQDRIDGLMEGADDYLVKPFAIPELLARIHALLRRGRSDQRLKMKVGNLHLDYLHRKVARGGRAIDLTLREFDLLHYLMEHVDRVVTRDMLARDVWKETNRATPLDGVIDVHISRLRKKIDVADEAALIHTIRGVGFSLNETSYS